MRRCVCLLAAVLALLVCAPEASAGCGKGFRLPAPFKAWKEKRQERKAAVETTTIVTATTTVETKERGVLRWAVKVAAPFKGGCKTGSCGRP